MGWDLDILLNNVKLLSGMERREKVKTLGFSFLQLKLYFMIIFFRYIMDYSFCCLSVFIFDIDHRRVLNFTAHIKQYSPLGYNVLVIRWFKKLLGNSISHHKKVQNGHGVTGRLVSCIYDNIQAFWVLHGHFGPTVYLLQACKNDDVEHCFLD